MPMANSLANIRNSDKERYLDRPGGRTLAYADAGDPSSSKIVLFFHGVFGVGGATRLGPVLIEKQVHYIAPTLPGWGNSSPPPRSTPFHACLYDDISALITHLHPNTSELTIYVSGGSYGTVAAQMLYGASYDVFPLGQHIAGVLLLAPFSPFRCHKGYTKCLSWANYLAIGPPAHVLPFKLMPRIGMLVMRRKVNTLTHAEAFIHDFGFKSMTQTEREAYEKYKAKRGIEDGQVEKEMGEGVYRSVHKTWEGFLTVSDVLHSDWGGYDPDALDEEHSKKPVLLVMNKEDRDNRLMGEWLLEHLKNAHGRVEEGGHMASIFVMDDIWADFMARVS